MVSPGVHQDFAHQQSHLHLMYKTACPASWAKDSAQGAPWLGEHKHLLAWPGLREPVIFMGSLFSNSMHPACKQNPPGWEQLSQTEQCLCALSLGTVLTKPLGTSPIADSSTQELEAKIWQLQCSLHSGCGYVSAGVICLRQPQQISCISEFPSPLFYKWPLRVITLSHTQPWVWAWSRCAIYYFISAADSIFHSKSTYEHQKESEPSPQKKIQTHFRSKPSVWPVVFFFSLLNQKKE